MERLVGVNNDLLVRTAVTPSDVYHGAPNTALVYVANIVTKLLPPSRCFRWKAFLFRMAGYDIAPTCRLTSSAQIFGSCRVSIGDHTFVGYQVLIAGGEGRISIGRMVDLAPRVCLISGTHEIDMDGDRSAGRGYSKDIVIEDGVWVGAGAIILGGVTLGHKCVVAAGSLVNRDVPPFSVVAGVPFRVVKTWDQQAGIWRKPEQEPQ
jgi:maltose O-acetyltransferase